MGKLYKRSDLVLHPMVWRALLGQSTAERLVRQAHNDARKGAQFLPPENGGRPTPKPLASK